MAELMLLRNRALKAGAATGLALAAVLTAGGASHAAATGAQGDSTQTAELGVLASAPRFISGYSYHCSTEMAIDSITGPEAQHVVSTKYSSARYDKKKASWKYTGSKIVVVLNNNGFCVTAWRR
jgi:Tfp pilus assembly protein PilV